MPKNNWTILSTRPLDETLIAAAAQKNVQIDCVSFIETEAIRNNEVEQQIQYWSLKNIVVVFTSMNAVDAVCHYLPGKPDWKIYCIGHATRQLVKNFFGEESIKGTADDGARLADAIIQNKEKAVVFFCGDQRRDELPNLLTNHQIGLEELVVYKTIPTQQKLDRFYNGVLFYSPSAVHSFFSVNKPSPETVLFAIGETTANAIRQYSNNQIVIASQPSKDALAQQAILFFTSTQQPISH